MSDILIISGSPSERSRSDIILTRAADHLAAAGLKSTRIGLRDFPATDLLYAKYDSPAFEGLKQQLANARGIIVSTPIYKASYTGGLKALLDILPQNALRGKVVLPIATGGSPAHLLAIDYAIKPVLSTLGASEILQGVYVIDSQFHARPEQRDAVPSYTLDPEIERRLDESLKLLSETVLADLPAGTAATASSF